jgi:hypothetical protein
MADFTLDISRPPVRRDFKDIVAGDHAMLEEPLNGLLPGDVVVQAALVAKVAQGDADSDPSAINLLIESTATSAGQIAPHATATASRWLRFIFNPAATTKLLAKHTYQLQVWVIRAGSTIFRTVMYGTMSANPDYATSTALVSEIPADNTAAEIAVVPADAGTIAGGATQQFTASARNAAHTAIVPQPLFTWKVGHLNPVGGAFVEDADGSHGAISGTGLYTAPASGEADLPFAVQATAGALSGTGGGDVGGTGPSADTAGGEVAAWQAAITGGDAAILGLKSAGWGAVGGIVADGANKVSNWKDLRKALNAAAPHAGADSVQATGADQPLHVAAKKAVSFSGGQNLLTALSPVYNLAPARTLIAILAGSRTSSTNAHAVFVGDPGTWARSLAIMPGARDAGQPLNDAVSTPAGMQAQVDSGGHTPVAAAGAAAPAGTPDDAADVFYLVIAGKNAATDSWVEMPHHARVHAAPLAAAMTAGDNLLAFNYGPFGPSNAEFLLAAVAYIDHELSEGEITALANLVATYYPAVTLL